MAWLDCPRCGCTFATKQAFDAHRIAGRRCRPVAEMLKAGWRLDRAGNLAYADGWRDS